MELSSSNNIKILIFSQKKAFLIFSPKKAVFMFQEKVTPKKAFYISGSNFPSSKNEKDSLLKCFLFFRN